MYPIHSYSSLERQSSILPFSHSSSERALRDLPHCSLINERAMLVRRASYSGGYEAVAGLVYVGLGVWTFCIQ